MAHKKIKIPVIAITPEAEEDDDHNYTTLADALTDVETLEFDNETIKHSVDKGKHKLIIKLGDANGAVTDTEDVEGSGDETVSEIVAHKKPISIDDMDLDPGTCKETHKVRSRNSKGKKKLHTQSSTVSEANAHLNLDSLYMHDGTTDVEDYSASDDDTPARPIKESSVPDQMLDVAISTKICDKFAQKKTSFTYESDADDLTYKKLTDVENLDSDSNGESAKKAPQNKKVKRRRQKPKHDTHDIDTDEENFEFRPSRSDRKNSDESNASSSNEGGRYDIKFKSPSVEMKLLSLPQTNVDEHTDVEALDSNDEQGVIDIPVAIVKRCKKGHSTEEEFLSDTDVSYKIEAVPEFSIPKPFRKLVTLRETISDRPIVTITPIDDDYVPGMRQYYQDATDEENFSDTEALLFAEALSRGATPELSIFEGGFEDITESIKIRRKSLRNASPALKEVLTDTEEILLGVGKKKAPFRYLSALTVSRPERHSLTDTEDLFLSDHDRDTLSRSNNDGGTDLESLAMSDDEYFNEKVDLLRALSTTPESMREMGGDTVLSKEGSGPFSDSNRLYINRRVPMVRSSAASPMLTDTEDLYASDVDDELVARVEASTPVDLHKELNESMASKVYAQNTHKIDLDAPNEVMYLKGGSYREVHTDNEEVNMSDDNLHACASKKKFSVDILSDNNVLVSMKKTCANFKDCPGPYRFKNGKEWDATTGKPSADGAIHAKGQPAVDAEKDARRLDTDHLSYESVLLTSPKRGSALSFPIPNYPHKTTSYTQIDAMLDRMLYEVEQQEQLFALDLDVLDQEDDRYVNTLELVPTTDALLEIPIKKTIKVPKRYETTHNIEIKPDLISFDEDDPDLDMHTIEMSVAKLLRDVEADEAKALLEEEDDDNPFEVVEFKNAKRASSESSCSTLENDQELYEPVDVSSTPYDIWWEGTYRNLSIVPEEEEDSIGSISKAFAHVTTNVDRSSDSSSDSSTEVGDNEAEDPIKADVQLLVKSNANQSEIEIYSVRDFIDTGASSQKSNTLPQTKRSGGKPVFTLPRVFVRPLQDDSQSKSMTNLNCKDAGRLLVTSPNHFPLQYDYRVSGSYEELLNESDGDETPKTILIGDQKIDLYANPPFFPCYNLAPSSPATEFTSHHDINIPKAYCDWLPQADNECRGEASSPSESVQPRQPAPFRDVGEEGHSEIPTQGPSSHSSQRFAADQHLLSEEMKQLLRDMEEESKK